MDNGEVARFRLLEGGETRFFFSLAPGGRLFAFRGRSGFSGLPRPELPKPGPRVLDTREVEALLVQAIREAMTPGNGNGGRWRLAPRWSG